LGKEPAHFSKEGPSSEEVKFDEAESKERSIKTGLKKREEEEESSNELHRILLQEIDQDIAEFDGFVGQIP